MLFSLTRSALTLLVTRIFANDAKDTLTTDDSAVTAQAFHRRSDFHGVGVEKKLGNEKMEK